MPQSVKKIIHYQDYGRNYHRLEFSSTELLNVKYVAGDFGSLIPEGMVLNTKLKSSFNNPLFNKSNNGRISEKIKSQTLLYLELEKNKAIKELYISPSNVIYDLYHGQDGLIYSFYCDAREVMLSLVLKIKDDEDGIFSKIKADPADIFFRQHFVRIALKSSETSYTEREEGSHRELMTVKQIADYLQMGVHTIQNWASDNKIPYVKLNKKRWYRKSEIDSVMEHVTKKK